MAKFRGIDGGDLFGRADDAMGPSAKAARLPGPLPVLTPQDVYDGDGGDNVYTGTSGPDDIHGNGGNDTLSGGGGDDYIDGGEGNDDITGGAGLDHLYGDAGNDVFRADHADLVADEYYSGGTGTDTILINTGAAAIDLTGLMLDSIETLQAGPLTVPGNPNGLTVTIAPGQLNGLDNLYIGFGTLQISAGGAVNFSGGRMQLLAINLHASGNTLNLSNVIVLNYSPTSGPYINGSGANDTVIGSNENDVIYGNDGNDTLDGGMAGADTLDGGAGDDRLLFNPGPGNDAYYGGMGSDTFDASNATSGVVVTLGLNPGDEGTILDSRLHDIENIDGSGFADTLAGSNAANQIQGLG